MLTLLPPQNTMFPAASFAEIFTKLGPAKAVIVPFQMFPPWDESSILPTVTFVTPTLSVAFTVTRIASPVFGVVVFRVTVLTTGSVVSDGVVAV